MFNEIAIGVFIAVVAGIILYIFGFSGRNTSITIAHEESTSKKWKLWIALGWAMFLIGIYFFSVNFQESGFYDPMTGFGFSLGFIGLILIWIGKFGTWWNKS